jgi:hypothetical protein
MRHPRVAGIHNSAEFEDYGLPLRESDGGGGVLMRHPRVAGIHNSAEFEDYGLPLRESDDLKNESGDQVPTGLTNSAPSAE